MKFKFLKQLILAFFLSICFNAIAQNGKANSSKGFAKKYPSTFVISKSDFDKLFAFKVNELISIKTNSYLDKSTPLLNTKNGDMKFLKIKLNYFKNAFLLIQVNGEFSTQIFIMSEDKSVFYKGKFDANKVQMTKCTEDEIVSE